jgi:hypothetical protein
LSGSHQLHNNQQYDRRDLGAIVLGEDSEPQGSSYHGKSLGGIEANLSCFCTESNTATTTPSSNEQHHLRRFKKLDFTSHYADPAPRACNDFSTIGLAQLERVRRVPSTSKILDYATDPSTRNNGLTTTYLSVSLPTPPRKAYRPSHQMEWNGITRKKKEPPLGSKHRCSIWRRILVFELFLQRTTISTRFCPALLFICWLQALFGKYYARLEQTAFSPALLFKRFF